MSVCTFIWRGKGLLRHVKGRHHLQFSGNGEGLLKAGAESLGDNVTGANVGP